MSDQQIKDCISQAISEGYPQDQAIAKCYAMYGKKAEGMPDNPSIPYEPQKPTKNKLELLAEFKKSIEKNGYKIEDSILESLINHLTNGVTPAASKRTSLKLSMRDVNWIKIFPRGTFYFEKYKDSFTFDDVFFNDVINGFESEKLFKPFMDIEHTLGEKTADIIELKVDEEGLFGRIEPNSTGIDLIKNNKYSYISPEWGDRTDTDKILHKNVLWAVTLTNIPAFEGVLQTLQDQIQLTKKKRAKMNDLKTRALQLEGRVSNFKAAVDPNAPAIDPQMLMEAIGMIKEALMKIDELTGQTQEQAAQIATQKFEIDEMNKEKEEKEIDDYFSESMKLGKVEANEVESLKVLYRLNKDEVVKLVSGRNEKGNTRLTTASVTSGRLTKEDIEIMKERGYNPEDPKDVSMYLDAIKE